MSPKEMKALSFDFIKELEKRLIADGYEKGCVEILQTRPNSHILRVVTDIWELYCDGNYADYQYLGKMHA